MIEVTWNDEPLWLWPWVPNWAQAVAAELALPSRIEVGLSDRESRRQTGHALRVPRLAFTCVLQGDAQREVTAGLRAITTARVMMPFWPALRATSAFAAHGVSSGLHLTANLGAGGQLDLSSYVLHAAATPDPGDWTVTSVSRTVPLLFGRLEPLAPRLSTPDTWEVSVTFAEDAEVAEALMVPTVVTTAGPTRQGTAHPVWPDAPDFTQPVRAGGTRLVVGREVLGQGRRQRENYHGATPYETIALGFTLEDWRGVAGWLHAHGDVTPCWLPVHRQVTELTAATSGTAATVADAAGLAVGDVVTIVGGSSHVVAEISSITGTDLTFDRSVAGYAAGSLVCPAVLARLAKRRVRLRWLDADTVTTELEFRALPPEALAVAPETNSLGAQPTLASLYTFTQRPSYDDLAVLQVAFVVDVSGSMDSIISATSGAIAAIIADVNPAVRVDWALVSYTSAAATEQVFTPSVSAITAALDGLTTGGADERAYDAIVHAATDLGWESGARGRLMVLLTDEVHDSGTSTEADALAALEAADIGLWYGLSDYPDGNPALTTAEGASFAGLAAATGGALLADVAALRALIIGQANAGLATYFTSYERDLADGSVSWTAIPISHGAIKRGLTLDDSCDLEAELTECPVLLAHWRKETGTVDVMIERGEVTGGTVANRRVVFAGEVRGIRAQGTKARVDCGIPRAFEVLLPRARFAAVCQWPLFSLPCGLASGDWTFSARVADVGTPGYPFTFVVDTLARQNGAALPGGFGEADWFAWGDLRTPDGDRVAVRQSTALNSGEITLTLARDPSPALAVDDVVTLRPGCDGLRETCQGKFDNLVNWGGALVAPANLSLIKVNVPDGGGSGGKK